MHCHIGIAKLMCLYMVVSGSALGMLVILKHLI